MTGHKSNQLWEYFIKSTEFGVILFAFGWHNAYTIITFFSFDFSFSSLFEISWVCESSSGQSCPVAETKLPPNTTMTIVLSKCNHAAPKSSQSILRFNCFLLHSVMESRIRLDWIGQRRIEESNAWVGLERSGWVWAALAYEKNKVLRVLAVSIDTFVRFFRRWRRFMPRGDDKWEFRLKSWFNLYSIELVSLENSC